MRLPLRTLLIATATLALGAATAHAGPDGDALAKCLVDSSSVEDRTAIVRWVFTAVAAHPAVKQMANVTDEQREATGKAMGELITRLLALTCKDATAKAVEHEGLSTVDTSFALLGQAAIQDMFGDPGVSAVLSGMEKYVDVKKLGHLDSGDKAAPQSTPAPAPTPEPSPQPSPHT